MYACVYIYNEIGDQIISPYLMKVTKLIKPPTRFGPIWVDELTSPVPIRSDPPEA